MRGQDPHLEDLDPALEGEERSQMIRQLCGLKYIGLFRRPPGPTSR